MCCANSVSRATTWRSSSTDSGGVAGLVTIEDVLEQIVSDIEDEYDFDETEDNIRLDKSGRYRVKARTEFADFNAAFGFRLAVGDADTIGGLILSKTRARAEAGNGRSILAGCACACCARTVAASTPCWSEPLPPVRRRDPCEAIRGNPVASLRRWCSALPLSPPLRRLPGIRWPGWPAAILPPAVAGGFAAGRPDARFRLRPWLFLTGTSWSGVNVCLRRTASCLPGWLLRSSAPTFLALFPALVGASSMRLRRAHFVTDATAFAALWVFARMAARLAVLGFPWLALGYSQSPPSPLAGYAPIVGVYGVTLVTLLVGAAFAELLRRWFASPCAGRSRVACRVPGRCYLPSRCWWVAFRSPNSAGANRAESRWWFPAAGQCAAGSQAAAGKTPESLAIYGRLMHDHPATLTVLPETAIPTFLDTLPRHYLEGLPITPWRSVGYPLRHCRR